MKTKKQLEGWIQKLNDDADMRSTHWSRGKNYKRGKAGGKNKAAKEELQRQNEEASAPGGSRPGTRGTSSGKSSVMTLSRLLTHSSIDPWQAFVPSIS